MGCGNCSSGGCGTGEKVAGCGKNGYCETGGCGKLEVFDWLAGMQLPTGTKAIDVVEVSFKSTRKEFYHLPSNLEVYQGEAVVVEAQSGYDIGKVSLSGELVRLQMQRRKADSRSKDLRKVLRKPDQEAVEKWQAARDKEEETMLAARKIAGELNLQMKIGDVEYQADQSKATFYYTADDRVDFRELIKLLAEQFKVRVDMRQIGARQEAGRLGGIGSCGRELCCSTWLTDFRSVSTSAARYQQLAINPMKLAGQCGKLKCCLNFELDSYMDALKDFPRPDTSLKTRAGRARHMKSDIFKGLLWYNLEEDPSKFICLTKERVQEIIALNKEGKTPDELGEYKEQAQAEAEIKHDFENVVGQDDLTRFDRDNKKRSKNKRKGNRSGSGRNSNSRRKGGAPKAQGKGESPKPKPNKGGGNNKRRRPPRNKKEGEQKKPSND